MDLHVNMCKCVHATRAVPLVTSLFYAHLYECALPLCLNINVCVLARN